MEVEEGSELTSEADWFSRAMHGLHPASFTKSELSIMVLAKPS